MNLLVEFLSEYSSIAIFLSLAINVIIAILGVVPSVFLTGANIIFFGAFEGFVISLLGESIGAAISFILYRIGFKKYFENLQNNKILNNIINSNGISVGIFIFQARLIPFIPSGFVTFAASLSKVSISIFFIASFLGKIPSIALEVLVSYDFININKNWMRFSLTLISVIIIFFTFKKRNKITS